MSSPAPLINYHERASPDRGQLPGQVQLTMAAVKHTHTHTKKTKRTLVKYFGSIFNRRFVCVAPHLCVIPDGTVRPDDGSQRPCTFYTGRWDFRPFVTPFVNDLSSLSHSISLSLL